MLSVVIGHYDEIHEVHDAIAVNVCVGLPFGIAWSELQAFAKIAKSARLTLKSPVKSPGIIMTLPSVQSLFAVSVSLGTDQA